jgi:hypothetical protein
MTTPPIPDLDREIVLAMLRTLRRNTDGDRATRVALAAELRAQARRYPAMASTIYRTARALRSC